MNKTRQLVIAFLLCAAIAAAAALWWLSLAPEGFILGLVPLDEERAVLLIRANEDDRSREWIGA